MRLKVKLLPKDLKVQKEIVVVQLKISITILLGSVTEEIDHDTVRPCISGFESMKSGNTIFFAPWADVQSKYGLSWYSSLTN
ncbi:hypothetical protein J27TS8_16480 [Robertmurraya siralis]|uniref:Uncharacterized protein n=1 Tax=Robertmurraya siralis TaxID=77777 RepID=A0A920BT14_9BACI|nr:hypothetical protein J27TS8_16480 [Robertmurraya siralis]